MISEKVDHELRAPTDRASKKQLTSFEAMLLINLRNKIGPSTEPCGTPLRTLLGLLNLMAPEISTVIFIFIRKADSK